MPPSRRRPELSPETIVTAALSLIDARGLDALNMRDLGVELGAATMSVYRHFRNKADLLDALIDQIVAGYAPTGAQQDWRPEARALSLKVRGAILAHPELAERIGREFRRSDTSLRVNAQIIERLRGGGVPEAWLAHTYWALSSYTTGFALLEAQALRRRRPQATPSDLAKRTDKIGLFLKAVDGLPSSTLSAAATVLARPLDEVQFRFGLDCLIEGLERTFEGPSQAASQTEA